jgi:anti-sigma factor ChrR (cupin superfamily)
MDADEALLERVRARVMETIRAEAGAPHLTVRADEDAWTRVTAGVERKVLYQSGAAVTLLLRLAPGVSFPGHAHAMDEECIVLEGSLRIGSDLLLRAGDYHLGRQGSDHPDAFTDTGALVMLRGATSDLLPA